MLDRMWKMTNLIWFKMPESMGSPFPPLSSPNSPHFNVMDLGFFNSMQSLQTQKPAHSIDELIQNVQTAFEELEPQALDNLLTYLKIGWLSCKK
jgi:hypothetical protein